MKSIVFTALAGTAAAQWWGGAPSCAQSCISSFYSSVSSTSAWPAPTAFCSVNNNNNIPSCLSSACSATPSAITSYSSMASSVCASWSSCSSAGSTGVYTLSWDPQNGGAFGPGSGGGPPFSGGGPSGSWGEWGSTFTGQSVTVTGCQFSGSPWMGGAGGPWGQWGAGWTWTTRTATVTTTITQNGQVTISTGLVAVAEAASGTVTSSTTLGAATATATSTSSGGSSAAAPGVRVEKGVVFAGVVFGLLLGVVVAL